MPKAESAKKPATKSAKTAATARVRKATRKQARVKAKTEARVRGQIPGSFSLAKQVFHIFKSYWKPLGGIVLVYLILNIVFASGIGNLSNSVSSIKADLNSSSNHAHPVVAGASGFLTLVSSAGAGSSSTGSALQMVLIVIESLVIIWALRQLLAGNKIGIRQSYYNAMTPLVPFLIVGFFIVLQLLPAIIGAAAFSTVATSISSASGLWTVLFGALFVGLAAWTIYMLSASVFAIYIVTLPGMFPRAALKSAANLVRYRRWPILRRVLFLPILLLLIMGVIMIPLILYATFLVVPVFYILSMLVILFIHSYLYSLYRGLL